MRNRELVTETVPKFKSFGKDCIIRFHSINQRAHSGLYVLRFSIVRCGRIAKRHCDLLGENQIEGAKPIAVADAKRGRAEAVGSAKNGVQTVINYPVALSFLEVYKYQKNSTQDFPNASRHQNETLSLPIYSDMTEQMGKYVTAKLSDFII